MEHKNQNTNLIPITYQPQQKILPDVQAIQDVQESLGLFAGYMGECFQISKADLDLIKNTKFVQLRGNVIDQSCLYFKMVVPQCVQVLMDLGNLFSDFHDYYPDYDAMKENIDMICDSTTSVLEGLILCEQMHSPVYREAQQNAKKVEEVMDEISQVDDDLKKQYQELKAEQQLLLKKAGNLKPNEIWKYIPIANTFLYDNKLLAAKKLKNQADALDSTKSEKQQGRNNINRIFFNVQKYLIPSLQAYLDSFKTLRNIIIDFHTKCDILQQSWKLHKNNLSKEEEELLHQVYEAMEQDGKQLGKAFSQTVHLFNQISTQFEAMKQFHEIEEQFREEIAKEINDIINSVKSNKENLIQSTIITRNTETNIVESIIE